MTLSRVQDSRHAIRGGSKTFYFASFFLSAEAKQAAYSYYRWCRYCDDQIDDAPSPAIARERLGILRQKTVQATESHATFDESDENVYFNDLRELQRQYQIPSFYFTDLIRGMEMDVEGKRYETVDDLYEYCYCVAGTVGLVMAKVLKARGENAYQAACALGIAMQLTNIARDVGADANMGRFYLPKSFLSEDKQLQPSHNDLFEPTTRLLAKADFFYQIGLSGLKFLPRRAAIAICAATFMYRAIGTKVLKLKLDWFATRAVVGPVQKFALTLAAFLYSLRLFFWSRVDETPKPFAFDEFKREVLRKVHAPFPKIAVLFDGRCYLCSYEIEHYKKISKTDQIEFIDITNPNFSPGRYKLNRQQVNQFLHVVELSTDRVVAGVDAFLEIWRRLPGLHYKILFKISSIKLVKFFLTPLYYVFARLIRPYLPKKKYCSLILLIIFATHILPLKATDMSSLAIKVTENISNLEKQVQELESGPQSLDVQIRLAQNYLLQGQLSESTKIRRELFEKGLKISEKTLAADAQNKNLLLLNIGFRGELAGLNKNLMSLLAIPKIESDLLKIAAEDPQLGYGAAHRGLGKIYLNAPRFVSVGSIDKAKKHLQSAYQIAPQWPDNRLAYAELLIETKQFKEARSVLADDSFMVMVHKTNSAESILWSRELGVLEKKIGDKGVGP